jgi:hypothetical protein
VRKPVQAEHYSVREWSDKAETISRRSQSYISNIDFNVSRSRTEVFAFKPQFFDFKDVVNLRNEIR